MGMRATRLPRMTVVTSRTRMHERDRRKLVEKCRQEAYDLVHQYSEIPAIQVEGAAVFCRR
jgi:hypothetical protein